MSKVYYWLKLKKDFFKDPRVKKLRRIAGGDTYTCIYLQLLLLSLETDGVLVYEGIEPTFAGELSLITDEDETNIQVTLDYLTAQGLMVQIDNKFTLTQTMDLMGSADDSKERVRRFRERQKQNQIGADKEQGNVAKNDDVTECNVTCNDVTLLEKEIELELEEEIDKKTSAAPTAEISNYYQKRIGIIDGQQYQILTDYLTLDGMELEVIKTAIDKAADNSKRSFSYINSILKNWRQNGIKTMVQVEDEQRQFHQKKQGQSDDDIQDPFIY